MSHTHRCGAVPPHLLEHLAQSSDPARAARARGTLMADNRHRLGRDLATRTTAPAPDREDEDKGKSKRAIHDAKNTEELPGKEVRKEGEKPSEDESVNRAYDHLGTTYRFFHEVYGRDSLDGKGMPLTGVVHYGKDYGNAFWDGKLMAFGDGDGDVFGNMTKDLTVIAHELAHGVTETSAKLIYFGQAGALNEHVSDVFGCLAVQWSEEQAADEASWLIGDAVFTGEVEGKALRSLKEPGKAYDDDVLGKDPQPGHMDDYVDTPMDNGGVHINSGIPNHAFYLLATELGGKAWETAGRIWFETVTDTKLKQDANFKDFAKATKAAAAKLHGDGGAEVKAVKRAWEKVGVSTG